jgi:CHAT domain-containing protein
MLKKIISLIIAHYGVFVVIGAQDLCTQVKVVQDSMDVFLRSDIQKGLELESKIRKITAHVDKEVSCRKELAQLFLDLAYIHYQRTDYQLSYEISGEALTYHDHAVLEHAFYGIWAGRHNEIDSISNSVTDSTFSFIDGMLLWNARGSRFREVERMLKQAFNHLDVYSRRIQYELYIWRSQNIMYSADQADLDQARDHLNTMLRLAAVNGDVIPEIWARYQLGFWARQNGNSIMYASQFKEVLRLNDRIRLWPRDHPFRFRIINALALALESNGDYRSALDYMDQAIDFHVDRKDTLRLSRRKLNKAKILNSIGEWDTAISLYQEIIPVFKRYEEIENLYSAYNNLGNIFRKKGEYALAREAASQSLILKRQEVGANHEHTAISHLNLGKIWMAEHQYDVALTQLDKAEEILRNLGRQKGSLYSMVQNQLGELYREEKQPLLARDRFIRASRALELVSEPDLTLSESYAYIASPIPYLFAQLNLAGTYADQANEKGSWHFEDSIYRFCIDYLETIRFGFDDPQSKLDLQALAIEIYDQAIQFYMDTYLSAPGQTMLANIFQLSDRSKAYALKNQLYRDQIQTAYGIPEDVTIQENILLDQIHALQNDMIHSNHFSDYLRDSTRKQLILAQDVWKSYQDKMRTNYPDYYYEKFQNKVDSLSEIQQRLKDNEVILQFHRLPQDLICIIIGKDFNRLEKIGIDENFQHVVEECLTTISDPKTSLETVMSALSNQQLLFMPSIIRHVPEETSLIIIPHRGLASFPFELLLTSNEQELISFRNVPYLFKSHPVRYAYAGSLVNRHPIRKSLTKRYLGAAPMCYPKELTVVEPDPANLTLVPLPNTAWEVERVAKSWRSTTLMGAQASKEQFILNSGEQNVLHLATHAFVDHQQPLFGSKMTFFGPRHAINSDLYAYELYHLNIMADLAVLSACQTGTGSYRAGEGVMSLARAFRFAGCPNTVTSLWSVNDRSTADIMVRFFKHLRKGKGIAMALTLAKTDYLQAVPLGSTQLLHPYYWAGFVEIGDDQELQYNTEKITWFAISGVAILLFLSLIYRNRNTRIKLFVA